MKFFDKLLFCFFCSCRCFVLLVFVFVVIIVVLMTWEVVVKLIGILLIVIDWDFVHSDWYLSVDFLYLRG